MKSFKYHLLHSAPLLGGAVLLCSLLPSCLNDDDKEEDYSEWKTENEKYVLDKSELRGENGSLIYSKYAPDWSPTNFVLVQWHKRPAGYQDMMHPLDNSTVDIKYRGYTIKNEDFDTSYNKITYGDSIHRTRPVDNIVGMHAVLTQMVPGDSVTVIIPWQAAYGSAKNSSILPYSTLIFDVKLKKIVSFDHS